MTKWPSGLKLQARLRGSSVEQEARRLLTEGTKLSRKEIAAEAAAMRARQPVHRTRGVDLIREDRDRRHRGRRPGVAERPCVSERHATSSPAPSWSMRQWRF